MGRRHRELRGRSASVIDGKRDEFEVGTLLDAGLSPDVWLWGNKNGAPLATLFETLAYTPQADNVARRQDAIE